MKNGIIILIVAALMSCTKEDKKEITHLCPDFMIYYTQGSGWTGWRFEVNIMYPDTLSIHNRIDHPAYNQRSAVYKMDANEVDSLFEDVRNLSRIKLGNYGFGPDKPTDLPTTFIKYKLCGCSDSAGIYVPLEDEVPVELYTLTGRVMTIVMNHDPVIGHNVEQ